MKNLNKNEEESLLLISYLEFAYAVCDTHKLVQKSERSDAHVFVIKTGLKVNYPK